MLSLTVLSALALSQTTPAPNARQLDAIQVTATRVSESTASIPTPVTILTRDQLVSQPATAMAEHLRGKAGAFVQRTGPGQGIVIVRGLKGSEVLHVVDGFRLNNAFFRNAPSQYIALVDPQAIDQLELVRGPASTLYGSDAMGGVIQILTPDTRYSGADGVDYGLRYRSVLGSAQLENSSSAQFSAAAPDVALTAVASYSDFGRYQAGGDSDRLPFTDYRSYGGMVKMKAKRDAHELIFNAQYYKVPRLNRYNELVPGFGSGVENEESTFEPNNRTFASMKYVGTGILGLDTLEAQVGQQAVDDNRRTRGVGSSNRDFEQNRSLLQGLSLLGARGFEDWHLTFGVDHYRDTVRSSRQRVNIRTGALTIPSSRFPDNSTQRETGLFAQTDWRIGERIDLLSGLRYTRYDVDLPRADRDAGVSSDFSDLTGQLGLRYALDDSNNLVANVGRGFRAPNIFDFGTLGSRPGNRFNQPNSDLGPERVLTFDAGIKHQSTHFSAELIGFISRYRDRLVSVETGGRTPTGQLIVRTENIGRSRLHGLEASATWRMRDSWIHSAALNLTRGTDELATGDAPGNRIPPINGSVSTRYQVRPSWGLGAELYFAARQDRLAPSDISDPRIDPNGTGGFGVVNLSVAYKPDGKNYSGILRFDNVLDKRYREHGSGIEGLGRGLTLIMERRFD